MAGVRERLQVPRRCPPLLLIKIYWREGKALGSEGRGLRNTQRREVGTGLYCVWSELLLYIDVGRATLERNHSYVATDGQ
jgi:hypothetical protein